MDRIAGAMGELEDSTMHFLDGAQQSQRSAENLDELSAKLTALTDRYRVGDTGSAAAWRCSTSDA